MCLIAALVTGLISGGAVWLVCRPRKPTATIKSFRRASDRETLASKDRI